jgi:hypothetical protein
MSSSRPVNNYPSELRQRAIRMVAEVRGEYASDSHTGVNACARRTSESPAPAKCGSS